MRGRETSFPVSYTHLDVYKRQVPEHRHKGLGGRISRFLVQRIQQKGKTPRLIAGYDQVAELYCEIGFAPCGRWGELYP